MKNTLRMQAAGLLLVGSLAVMVSCDKKDAKPAINAELLSGRQWRLNRITFNEQGQDVEDNIPACRQDDGLEFRANNVFIRQNGTLKCFQEPDTESGRWSFNQSSGTLTFESSEYKITELSRTALNLEQDLQGVDGNVIIKTYYVPQ